MTRNGVEAAVAVAIFVTEPKSMSAWSTAYDAVQVMDALGARLAVAGQNSSRRLVVGDGERTREGHVARVRQLEAVIKNVARRAVRRIDRRLIDRQSRALGRSRGLRVGRMTNEPPAGVPVADALFTIVPKSRSACVTECDAVQVATSPGARSTTSHVGAASTLSSLTETPVIVTLPVFSTTYW